MRQQDTEERGWGEMSRVGLGFSLTCLRASPQLGFCLLLTQHPRAEVLSPPFSCPFSTKLFPTDPQIPGPGCWPAVGLTAAGVTGTTYVQDRAEFTGSSMAGKETEARRLVLEPQT